MNLIHYFTKSITLLGCSFIKPIIYFFIEIGSYIKKPYQLIPNSRFPLEIEVTFSIVFITFLGLTSILCSIVYF